METARTLWIGTEPNPNDRLQISVNVKDSAKIPPQGQDALGQQVTVTDQRTHRRITLRRASCGLDCACALELVQWGRKTMTAK